MDKQRPDRKPNLTISNIRIDEDECAIFYNLAHNKSDPGREEFWQIPHNSTFDPNIEMEIGGSYAVWTEEISVPYTTASGKQKSKKRYDWCWIERLDDYEFEPLSPMAQRAKHKIHQEKEKKLQAGFKEIETAVAKFRELFTVEK
jgi:hypothetical protein